MGRRVEVAEGTWKRGIGRVMSWAFMQGICPESFRVRVERQVDLEEAGRSPIKNTGSNTRVEQGTGDFEDDRKSTRKSGKPSHMGVGSSDGADQST